MPYIDAKTNVKITNEQKEALIKEFGKAIEKIPGKSEEWLMLSFSDDVKMYFRGDDSSDTAYVEVSIFGKASPDSCEKVTAAICELYEKKLGISADRVYVRYEESSLWGWNGSNF
jgi:phenylpyruvate tautomerase PptA (4-oxalocrotonate tautomerase family)